MKKSIAILGALLCFFGVIAAFFTVIPIVFETLIRVSWSRAVVFLLLFIIIQFFISSRDIYQKSGYKYGMIIVFILFVVFWDIEGNALFNKPLEWIISSAGTLKIETLVESYAGTTSINSVFSIVKPDGTLTKIPLVFILLYRVIQYYVLLLLVYFINDKTLVKLYSFLRKKIHPVEKREYNELDDEMKEKIKKELDRRERDEQEKENLSPELYEHLKEMKREEKYIQAIRLVRVETDGRLSIEEAKKIIDDL
jgi:hypothetical protein